MSRTEADIRAAIAFEIRAELVCCDIYDRLSQERDERGLRTVQTNGHDLCYWGEAAARIAESHELRTLGGEQAPAGLYQPGRVAGAFCPYGPHRGPQGPNEDVAMCLTCGSVSYAMRPEGETFGDHRPDCSLPRRHESYCRPGGAGHPKAPTIRGFWPDDEG